VRGEGEAKPSQDPEGPTPIEPCEAYTRSFVWRNRCKEAEAVNAPGESAKPPSV